MPTLVKFNLAYGEITDPVHLTRLLCLDGKRRKSETNRENDPEPDQPHGHLV